MRASADHRLHGFRHCAPADPQTPGDKHDRIDHASAGGSSMSDLLLHTHHHGPADTSLAARCENWLGHAIELPAAALVIGEVAVLLAGVISRFIFNSPIP